MKRILLVDDEPHVIRVLRMALEQGGYLVDDAANGVQALEYLNTQHPDIMITDIDMPCMNGKELCLEIERQFPDRSFGIYVLTARAERELRQWASNMSKLVFMEKPVSIRKLVSKLDDFFADGNVNGETACLTAP